MWREAQDAFAAALRRPDSPPPAGVVGGDGRFDVYRNNVAASLRDALAEAYPVVKALVGDEFFAAMAWQYIRSHLPSTPVLLDYGRGFPCFIAGFAPADKVPYLADVARLERLWLAAYHAEDAAPSTVGALAAVAPADMDALHIRTHPSLGLLRSGWPVASIWRAHQGGGTPDLSGIARAPEHVRVVRPGLEVSVSVLSEPAFDLLARLGAGVPLGAALAAFDGTDGDDPSAALMELFQAGCVRALQRED